MTTGRARRERGGAVPGEARRGAAAAPADERVAAAAALAALPNITATRLRRLLDRWPDPVQAAAEVAAGRAGGVLGDDSAAASLARQWRDALDLPAAAALVTERRPRLWLRSEPGFPCDPNLPHCPALLLGEGEGTLEAPRVAIVGTRAATPHGLDDAYELGGVLTEEGVAVVSGLAIGIDGAAHRGALDAGGSTIGVVATGLDVVYPRRHEILFRQVREQGLLVSEVGYGTPPQGFRFPIRNRIIAALADVVVVVEATRSGGARITAEWALFYGRPVLAVPGSRRNPAAAGCNALIADGATPLLEPADVLTALEMTPGARRGWSRPQPTPLAGDAAAVLSALAGEPATADQLASRTGLSPQAVAVAVGELDRAGLVARSRGMVWPR